MALLDKKLKPISAHGTVQAIPSSPAPQKMIPSGLIKTPSGEIAAIDNTGRVLTFDAAGNKTTGIKNKISSAKPAISAEPQVVRNDNGGVFAEQKIGNMDINFGPGVDQATRERVMSGQVRPTAQINRYESRQGISSGYTPRVKYSTESKPQLNTFTDIMRHNAALKEKRLDAGIESEASQNEIAAQALQQTINRDEETSSLAKQALANEQPLKQATLTEQLLKNKQAIQDTEKADQMAGLQKELLNKNTSAERLKQIKDYLKAIGVTKAGENLKVFPGQVKQVLKNGQMVDEVTPPTLVDPATGTFSQATQSTGDLEETTIEEDREALKQFIGTKNEAAARQIFLDKHKVNP